MQPLGREHLGPTIWTSGIKVVAAKIDTLSSMPARSVASAPVAG
jgi:hypothetical protein